MGNRYLESDEFYLAGGEPHLGDAAIDEARAEQWADQYGEYGDRAYTEKGGDDFFDAKSRKQWARKLFKSIDGITYGTSVGGRTFRKAADALLDVHYPLDAESGPFVPFSAHIARCAEHIPSEFLDAPLVDVNPEGDLTRQDGKAVSEHIAAQLTSLSVST